MGTRGVQFTKMMQPSRLEKRAENPSPTMSAAAARFLNAPAQAFGVPQRFLDMRIGMARTLAHTHSLDKVLMPVKQRENRHCTLVRLTAKSPP